MQAFFAVDISTNALSCKPLLSFAGAGFPGFFGDMCRIFLQTFEIAAQFCIRYVSLILACNATTYFLNDIQIG